MDVAHLLLQLTGADLLVDVLLGAIPCDERVFAAHVRAGAGARLVVGVRVVGRPGREGRRRREAEVGTSRRRRVQTVARLRRRRRRHPRLKHT